MSYKKKAFELAKSLGAKIVDSEGAYELEAPGDLVSGAYFLHVTVYNYEDGIGSLWKEMIADLRYGFTNCTNKDCGFDHEGDN